MVSGTSTVPGGGLQSSSSHDMDESSVFCSAGRGRDISVVAGVGSAAGSVCETPAWGIGETALCGIGGTTSSCSGCTAWSGAGRIDGAGTGSISLVVASVHCATATFHAALALSGRGRGSIRLASWARRRSRFWRAACQVSASEKHLDLSAGDRVGPASSSKLSYKDTCCPLAAMASMFSAASLLKGANQRYCWMR